MSFVDTASPALPPHADAPAQPLPADQYVLQRLVQRVADVQHARNVWRRQHDGEGLRFRARRAECAGCFPVRIPAAFDIGGFECLL